MYLGLGVFFIFVDHALSLNTMTKTVKKDFYRIVITTGNAVLFIFGNENQDMAKGGKLAHVN